MAESASKPTYPDLKGRVAIVTGGSKGVGAVTCRMLARQGTKVAVNGRDLPAIEKVVDEISAEGGCAIAAPADCGDFRAVEIIEPVVVALTKADLVEHEEFRLRSERTVEVGGCAPYLDSQFKSDSGSGGDQCPFVRRMDHV